MADSETHSIDEAIAFFDGLAAAVRRGAAEGVREGTEVVLAATREIVGHYQQNDLGSADPWEELSDWTKQDRGRQGYPENLPGLRDGTMRDSYTATSRGLHGQVGSGSLNAFWFELGTDASSRGGPQPPRMVLGLAAWRNREKVVMLIGTHINRAILEAMRR